MVSSQRRTSLLVRCVLAMALFVPLLSIANTSPLAAQSTLTTFPVDPGQDPLAIEPTPVWAIEEANGRYYIGGQFTQVSGQTQAFLAAVNVATGQLDPNFRPVIAGGVTEVKAIALSPDGQDLYFGGNFRTVDGVARERIAKVDAITGALDTAFNPGADALIETIAVDAAGVYVGGRFNIISGQSSPNLARLATTTGRLNPNWTGSTNGTVFDVEVFAGNLYVGGNFTSVSGESHSNLVRVRRTTGTISPAWDSVGTPERVQSLALSDDGRTVFAGTGGTLNNGNNGNAVWAFSLTGIRQWQRVLGGDVQALETQGDTLFVGTHGDVIYAQNQFLLDGTTPNPNFPVDGYNDDPNNNTNATQRRKLLSLTQRTGSLLPFDPHLNSVNGVWELQTGASGLLVGGDFTEVLNPNGITGTNSPAITNHVAIFANPSAPEPTPDDRFSCTVTTNGNSATIRFAGDRGTSLVLRRNGSFAETIADGELLVTIAGGAGDTWAGRLRGPQYADPFEDIPCTNNGGPTPGGGAPLTCTVSTSGNNAIVDLMGDLGTSNQLLINGSWNRTITGQSQVTVIGGAGDNYAARVRGAQYADPFQDISCTGDGGTPLPGADDPLTCTVTTNGNNAIIDLMGDLGTSNQLLLNGSWNRTITGQSQVTVIGGAGGNYAARVRGAQYADPFQDISCN